MSKNKLTIGVIFGGRSGEHEVSIVSAQSVMRALDKKKYNVVPIKITKTGQWVFNHQASDILKQGLSLGQIDVFFPVLHGPYGEDGTIQGLFEMANVPYVGAGVLGSAVGMDKIIQKQLFAQAKLPQVKYFWFLSHNWPKNSVSVKKQARGLRYPVFVKPANLGSSVGISKAHNQPELTSAIKLAARYDRKILVEQGLENIQEIECSVLGNDEPMTSVPGEVIASNEFYDYDAKYVDGKSKIIIPAQLSKSTIKKIQQISALAFKVLDLSGLARVDFFVKKNQVYLSEVNTIPGFTSISMYPKLWEVSGLPYHKLLDKLIKLAQERWQEKQQLQNSYQPKKEWYQQQ